MHGKIDIRINIIFLAVIFLMIFNLVILLDIPILRQTFAFLLLTLFPGFLFLQIFGLNKLELYKKVALSVGLSVSILMIFGLIFNYFSLAWGCSKPFATMQTLVFMNLIFIIMAFFAHRKQTYINVACNGINLKIMEKFFVIISVLLVPLSIFGMYIMNQNNNNKILIIFFFLIISCMGLICFFNKEFPSRLFPIIILSLSLSLIMLKAMRSNHILGDDIHAEYYFFQFTLNNLHWGLLNKSTLDSCLSISLLPTVYLSLVGMNPEIFFKIFYPLIFSIVPLVIYIISCNYLSKFYAFLTTSFFMSQTMFLNTTFFPRTSMAIMFFALAIMIIYLENLSIQNKKILIIIFVASCVISHYSTTYVFFFLILLNWLVCRVMFFFALPFPRFKINSIVDLNFLILFFVLIIFWYSQITIGAFDSGMNLIMSTFSKLNEFFLIDSRGGTVAEAIGQYNDSNLIKLKFYINWMVLILLPIGVITILFNKYINSKFIFRSNIITSGYYLFSLACITVIIVSILLPYVLKGFALNRLYYMILIVLSLYFVIGVLYFPNFSLVYNF